MLNSKHSLRIELLGQPFDNFLSRLLATELSHFWLTALFKVRRMAKAHGGILLDVKSVAELDLRSEQQTWYICTHLQTCADVSSAHGFRVYGSGILGQHQQQLQWAEIISAVAPVHTSVAQSTLATQISGCTFGSA